MLKRGYIKEQQDLLGSLIQDYNAIYYVDLNTDRFSVLYANNVVNQDVHNADFENNLFSKAMKDFTEVYVRDEDKEMLLRLTDCQYVKDRLEEEKAYAFRYRVNPSNGLEFFEVRMTRPIENDDEHFAVMTVRNCDKQAREELAYQLEIEERNCELVDALMAEKGAERSKSDFFARMSHDLRTPMNVILGLADLSSEEDSIEDLQEDMKKIHTTGQYLLSIINDSLDFQKIEAGGMTLKPEIVHTSDLVSSITDLATRANKEKNINVRLRNIGVDQSAYIEADPIRMKQIFVNLISNAIKFTPSGGTVDITIEVIERMPTMVHDRITIADTGIGMSKEFLQDGLFKPFCQEHNSVTSDYAGTGLGLSIAKQLLDLMGGTVKVESELGEGTTFTVDIDFKLVDEEKVRSLIQAKEKQKLNILPKLEGIHVLLAEDHPLNAEIAIKLLEKTGCKVNWAENGKIALDTYLRSDPFRFDVILMDIRMPVMNGLEAAAEIRKQDREDADTIPIIAMTANAYDEDIKASLDAGMNAHLAKPFNPQQLYEVIGQLITR